jgi:predicted dinucleotide-binding enzyme
MINPKREEGTPDLFIAGDDEDTNEAVTKLAKQLVWESIIDL